MTRISESEARLKVRGVQAEMQARVPEILTAITAGTATDEQLRNVVELPDGRLKTWRHVTATELESLRRAHAY